MPRLHRRSHSRSLCRVGAVAVTALLAVTVAACSSSSSGSSATMAATSAGSSAGSGSGSADGPATTTTSAASTTTPAAASNSTASSVTGLAPIAQPSPAGTWGTEPTVTIPSGPAPTELAGADLITGTGPAAKAGDNLTVQYVGVSELTRQTFDASWTDGQPFPFTLGAGQVIPGWDQGVVGMSVGGRRELIIPAALAYGAQSPSPKVGANATLIFVVDLLKIG
jgi:peptidylprolyl isomerase